MMEICDLIVVALKIFWRRVFRRCGAGGNGVVLVNRIARIDFLILHQIDAIISVNHFASKTLSPSQ